MGAVITVTGAILWFGFGSSGLVYVLLAAIVVAATLESVFAICLGPGLRRPHAGRRHPRARVPRLQRPHLAEGPLAVLARGLASRWHEGGAGLVGRRRRLVGLWILTLGGAGNSLEEYPPESGGYFLQSLCNSYILFAPITSGGRRAAIGDILVLWLGSDGVRPLPRNGRNSLSPRPGLWL